MTRVLLIGLVVIVALSIFAAIDSLMTDVRRVRGLPKVLWVVVILFLPVIGAVLWLTLGKDRGRGEKVTRNVAPDDDPEFLRKIGSEKEQEERIRRLEQELADLDDDPTTKD